MWICERSGGRFLQLFKEIQNDVEGVRLVQGKITGFLEDEAAASLEMIITSVESAKEADFKICFDPTLVRGMSSLRERSLRSQWTSSAVR